MGNIMTRKCKKTEAPLEENYVTVIATFGFINSDAKLEFLDVLKSENGLKVTRNFKGNISIEYYEDIDNESNLVLIQKWETKEDHQAYLKMRTDAGLISMIGSKLVTPLVPVYLEYNKEI